MVTITVVGASGLIGSRVVAELRARGHRVVPASRRLGVDTLTGRGLEDAIRPASVVIDVTNPGSGPDADAMAFFETSTRNLLAMEARFGARHHVVLSVVGTPQLAIAADPATTGAGYFRAKRRQEDVVRASGMPYTIVRSTQFYEFLTVIAQASSEAGVVRLPPAWIQPVAADDVAAAVADAALGSPANDTIELAGPVRLPFDEAVRLALSTTHDGRRVVADPGAAYFGIPVGASTLLPRGEAMLGGVTIDAWRHSAS